jgi:hypothetical protein
MGDRASIVRGRVAAKGTIIMRRVRSAIVGLMLLAAPAAASDGRQAASAAAEAARALQQQAIQIATAGKRLEHLRAIAAALNARKS